MKNDLNFELINQRIRELRMEQNMTQENLAQEAGVNTSHICNIENNRVKVSLTCLVHICNALHTTLDYMLYDNYTDPDIQSSSMDRAIERELRDCSDYAKQTILELIPVIRTREPAS